MSDNRHVLLRETIRYAAGRFHRLELHHERLARSARVLGRRALSLYEMETALSQAFYSYQNSVARDPSTLQTRPDRLRCKLSYNEVVSSIEVEPYVMLRPKVLVLADIGTIEYAHKYADRSLLDELKQNAVGAAKKGSTHEPELLETDWDVLLHRRGLLLDCSYANIVWQPQSSQSLLTPKLPLLEGVRRRAYINEGRLSEVPLELSHLIDREQTGFENGRSAALYWPHGKAIGDAAPEFVLLPLAGRLYIINAMVDIEDDVSVDYLAVPLAK